MGRGAHGSASVRLTVTQYRPPSFISYYTTFTEILLSPDEDAPHRRRRRRSRQRDECVLFLTSAAVVRSVDLRRPLCQVIATAANARPQKTSFTLNDFTRNYDFRFLFYSFVFFFYPFHVHTITRYGRELIRTRFINRESRVSTRTTRLVSL